MANFTVTDAPDLTQRLASLQELTLGGGNSMLTLRGSNNNNTMTGGAGPETLLGLGGNDTLNGMGGADFLVGGAGRDKLTGGAGKDHFVFAEASHISEKTATGFLGDVITDFQSGVDKIDLKAIDASETLDGKSDFVWVGEDKIGRDAAGEVRFQQFDKPEGGVDYTMVYLDTNGTPGAEYAIKCLGLINFTADDFVL